MAYRCLLLKKKPLLMDMDKRSMLGLFMILVLFIVWQQMIAPSAAELEAQQRYQDSIAQIEVLAMQNLEKEALATPAIAVEGLSDSAKMAQFGTNYGSFASAVGGQEELLTLENDLMIVQFTTKGGRVKQVQLKEYAKVIEDENGQEIRSPLYLLENDKNRFDYLLPVKGVANGVVRSSDLNFQATREGNSIIFRAPSLDGGFFEQRYSLADGDYLLDYDLRFEGLGQVLTAGDQSIRLQWENHLDKIEKNDRFESTLTTVYYKPLDERTDHCSCTSDDIETLDEKRLKWVANSQQFFTSALFADEGFPAAELRTISTDPTSNTLKILSSDIKLPFKGGNSETVGLSFYVGPNEFDRMRAIGHDFSDVIPFGRSIFGAINRWLIRPVFNFLDGFIHNQGISILILTLLVKLMVYPLTYKMLVSNMKMQVLKPEIEKLKNKHGEDKQALQMETMKMYQEYGASPLGGCLPMVLQMPIWFALYRFFPAAIQFRQANFLWATDLSTYDSFIRLPFEIPLGFGAHISLFAILWAITTLIYAYYNSKHQDFSAQPAMKWMQYLMPIMFLGFFNSFASGLTAYLFFSNLFNIGQTLVTKEFLIDENKLLAKLQENKKKPKKKGGFTERLQEALKEQQRAQAEIEAKKAKNK